MSEANCVVHFCFTSGQQSRPVLRSSVLFVREDAPSATLQLQVCCTYNTIRERRNMLCHWQLATQHARLQTWKSETHASGAVHAVCRTSPRRFVVGEVSRVLAMSVEHARLLFRCFLTNCPAIFPSIGVLQTQVKRSTLAFAFTFGHAAQTETAEHILLTIRDHSHVKSRSTDRRRHSRSQNGGQTIL